MVIVDEAHERGVNTDILLRLLFSVVPHARGAVPRGRALHAPEAGRDVRDAGPIWSRSTRTNGCAASARRAHAWGAGARSSRSPTTSRARRVHADAISAARRTLAPGSCRPAGSWCRRAGCAGGAAREKLRRAAPAAGESPDGEERTRLRRPRRRAKALGKTFATVTTTTPSGRRGGPPASTISHRRRRRRRRRAGHSVRGRTSTRTPRARGGHGRLRDDAERLPVPIERGGRRGRARRRGVSRPCEAAAEARRRGGARTRAALAVPRRVRAWSARGRAASGPLPARPAGTRCCLRTCRSASSAPPPPGARAAGGGHQRRRDRRRHPRRAPRYRRGAQAGGTRA